MTTIKVTYKSATGEASVEETLTGTPYRFARIRSNESAFRFAIDAAEGQTAAVPQDLYRWLVISNFARRNEKGGSAAQTQLDELYPDRNTLPNFKNVSARFNTAGVIYHNIKNRDLSEGGYGLLPSFLSGLLQAVMAPPVCEQ